MNHIKSSNKNVKFALNLASLFQYDYIKFYHFFQKMPYFLSFLAEDILTVYIYYTFYLFSCLETWLMC